MKYIKHIILTAMAVLLVAGPVWAMQLYVITPSGQVTLEVEPSDSFENIKEKIKDKTGFNPTYQHLYYNHIECYNGQTLNEVGITSGGQTLTMTYDQPYKDGNTWVFTMPAANKLLEVENYNTYTLTLSHNAGHGTVELLRPGSSATVGNAENAFQYCYDCQRSPAYPTVANNGNNNLSGFTNPYVGLNGVGTTNNPLGPWKLEYVGQYSHSEYNFSVSGVRHTYGLSSDEAVPIFLLYQWSSATNQYEPVVYGVACAYSKLDNTHSADHTLLFVAEGHWGCFLSNNQHSQNLNIYFDEDLSMGMHDFAEAATPALPEGVTDNGNGTYTVVSGTELTIEAIANSAEHYYFDNWTNEQGSEYTTGVVTPTGPRPATSLLTLTITGDTTVRGNFRIDTFDLTLSTNNANMGHIDIGGQQYESKDTMLTDHQHIDVAAIPEPGHYFVNWTDANGIEKSKNTHIMVTAISDTTLTANFAPYAILQIASNYDAWGTVALQAGTTGNHELTLYDESESTSNHLIPAYTCWFDALTRSQHVIPATKLAEVKGGTISSIKYYAQDPVSWTSNKAIDVYLKEVTNTTLNSLVDKSSCTVVYNGQLNVVDGIVTITFSSPFSYNGGDLLVGIENLEAGNYNCGVSFLGEDVPGASIGGRGGNFTQQDFLPMSTFTYQPSGVKVNPNGGYYIIPGNEVTVTATPETDYHLVNWTDEENNVMGTDAQLTFTITGDTTAMANFQSNSATFTLTLASNDETMGTVTMAEPLPAGVENNGGGNYTVHYGVTVTLVATPIGSYQFLKWAPGDSTTATIHLTAGTEFSTDVTYTATFGPATPGLTPEGEVTVQGNRFVDEYGQIVGSPRLTEHGEFIDNGNSPQPVHLIGKFSVSSTQKVYFSPANLQYTRTSTSMDWSTGTWSFLAHQYSSVETAADPYCTENYGDKTAVGLFGWGTWGESKTPNLTSISNTDYTWNTDFSEPLGGYNDWRTLTKDEWTYLLNTRATGVTVNSTNNARYTLATINTGTSMVKGMIIFPDGFTGNNTDGVTWGTINAASNYTTTCTTAGWNALESANCLFLPATGWRAINETINDCTRVEGINSWGYYWTNNASNNNTLNAYVLKFDSQVVEPDELAIRRLGFSVRLVRNAE
jgi:hypothetical protein